MRRVEYSIWSHILMIELSISMYRNVDRDSQLISEKMVKQKTFKILSFFCVHYDFWNISFDQYKTIWIDKSTNTIANIFINKKEMIARTTAPVIYLIVCENWRVFFFQSKIGFGSIDQFRFLHIYRKIAFYQTPKKSHATKLQRLICDTRSRCY